MSSSFVNNVEVVRSMSPDLRARPDSLLPPASVSRRPSKGSLRDLFTKNRSAKILASTAEQDETSTTTGRNTACTDKIDPSWIPPPLFQAYPQSVMHGKLDAPDVSAPTILRMNQQQNANPNNDGEQSSGTAYRASAIIAQAGWTYKVYVLTTSGHLLQYAGEGTFDRKPEKILRLGKNSAAFASDAIEGRPFVLQVAQSCGDDLDQAIDGPKRIFSRMGIRTPATRRATSVLLLVCNAPEQLESWLLIIRKTIQKLGGRAHDMETTMQDAGSTSTQDFNHQRYVARKSPVQLSRETSSANSKAPTGVGDRSSTQSSTYTATELERLRDSKTSHVTAVTGTASSSVDSPPPSPDQEKTDSTKLPQLVLPDLGAPSLGDFPSQRRRQSRFSLPFSEAAQGKPAETTPMPRIGRQGSVRTRLGAKRTSILDIGRPSELGRSAQEEGWQGKSGDKGQRDGSESSDPERERPASTISPLPSASPAPFPPAEPSAGGKYSLFPDVPETSSQVPKRYSSLGYPNLPVQPHRPVVGPADTLYHVQADSRNPNSMHSRREPAVPPQEPGRTPSVGSRSSSATSSASITEASHSESWLATETPQREMDSPFGPPACPPPSGPLPALPSKPSSSRRLPPPTTDAR